jgi:hypothetical protein
MDRVREKYHLMFKEQMERNIKNINEKNSVLHLKSKDSKLLWEKTILDLQEENIFLSFLIDEINKKTHFK